MLQASQVTACLLAPPHRQQGRNLPFLCKSDPVAWGWPKAIQVPAVQPSWDCPDLYHWRRGAGMRVTETHGAGWGEQAGPRPPPGPPRGSAGLHSAPLGSAAHPTPHRGPGGGTAPSPRWASVSQSINEGRDNNVPKSVSSSGSLPGASLFLGEGEWGACIWVGVTPEAGAGGGEGDSMSLGRGGRLGFRGLWGIPESSQ